jgi:curved DNA-binding protein CbpA
VVGRAMHDNVDLPLPHRRRIEEVHAALPTLSHYDLLGVRPNADRRAIGRAYLERTLEFQSTRYFARKLGHYREMMDDIFRQVTAAYLVLNSPARRAVYDGELRTARLSSVEDMIQAELASMRESNDDIRRDEVPRTKSGTIAKVTPEGHSASGAPASIQSKKSAGIRGS